MACMCGDYCCPSCGPAQGNWKCPICNEWVSEGCDHIDEETGDLRPEFEKQAEEIARQTYEAEAAMYQEYLAEAAMYQEYLNEGR